MPPSRLERLQASLHAELQQLPDRPGTKETPSDNGSPQTNGHEIDTVLSDLAAIKLATTLRSNSQVDQHVKPKPDPEMKDHEQVKPKHDPQVEVHEQVKSAKNGITKTRLPECSLMRGELAPFDQTYTPIMLFSKYPYRFVPKAYSERVADAFFNAGKFWERTWDLYYFWPPGGPSKPFLLITELQAQVMIKEINQHFASDDIELEFTTEQRHELGLVIAFKERHPHLTPRYLGRSSSREQFNEMERTTPSIDFRPYGEPEVAPPDDLEAFKAWFEEEAQKSKATSKALKARKKEERLVLQRTFVKQLRRTQRYLGLYPKKQIEPMKNPAFSGLPDDTMANLQSDWEATNKTTPINVTHPAPYPFDNSVVFIAIDVEAYERDQTKITEIGVSTLDVQDLTHLPPGRDGKTWRSRIRTRHIWIKEHQHLRNRDFVAGCPDRFEFGSTEVLSLADARGAIAGCFGLEGRNVVLVGHDPNADIRYLHAMGCNPLGDGVLEVLDTAALYRTWKRETQTPSLGSVLFEFGIVGWNLHNAGNDAHYTLQAMLAVVVREASVQRTAGGKGEGSEVSVD